MGVFTHYQNPFHPCTVSCEFSLGTIRSITTGRPRNPLASLTLGSFVGPFVGCGSEPPSIP